MRQKIYFKGAKPDGWDFYTGKTINYRENIGKTVKVPHCDEAPQLCSASVIHASKKPNNIFVGCRIPLSLFKVRGTPVVEDEEKSGFKELFVVEEIPEKDFNKIFGWNYTEASNPINPLNLSTPTVSAEDLKWLKVWASVGDSVWTSVGDSVGDSVWASVGDSVWTSVGDSVWTSVGASVGASVWASVWAYIGSLFPKIPTWKYIEHKKGEYPYQPCVYLWKRGLIPSFDGKTWRLHGGVAAKILWEEKI